MAEVTKVEIKAPVTGPTAPTPPKKEEQGERPAWLDAKFKSPEELANAYAELQKKLGGKSGEETPTEEAPTEEQQTETPTEETKEEEQKLPVNVSEYEAEFSKNGKLSDESYTKLADAGYTREMVDNYIAGQHARADAYAKEVYSAAGGEDAYKQMVTWAAASLSADEKKAFNDTLNAGDTNAVKLAVAGLKARYTTEYGKSPNLVGGGRGPSGPAPYESREQMMADMRNPKYARDPAFRKQVQDRLANSDIL